jgi:hypothetical protein
VRLLSVLLFIAVLSSATLSAAAEAPLQRGVKGEVEDQILVGADDWHASVAATPLAIWSEDNRTVVKPLLILPKEVNAGERNGWVEQSDLDRYGVSAVLDTFKAANITAITAHGEGDQVKALVEAAHKDGLKAYVTASLELPKVQDAPAVEIEAVPEARKALLAEAGLASPSPDASKIDRSWLQVPNPDIGGNASYFCPVNPEVRDHLYSQIETLIDDYKADGVVLYKFGFQDENYCFCDICKEKFYQDTGIDITKVNANSYNQERWNQWKQEQVMQIVKDARNVTDDLGPVKLGVALDNPLDRSQGYDFAEMAKVADFSLISPLSVQDVRLASGMSEKPVFVRLSDDYVGYVLSTQNVEGAVKYIEDLTRVGAKGVAFEYNVVYTPLWSELEPPSSAARWLMQQLGGKSLAIGNISWKSDSVLSANNSFEMAEKLSLHWKSSPGAVIVGENYSAALSAAPIASYLNWPVLFVDRELPGETALALKRLGAKEAVIVGPISEKARQNLSEMNLTLLDGNSKFLIKEMKERGESPTMVVMTNSHDLSLLPPAPNPEVERTLLEDLLVRTEVSPSQIPAEEMGEIVRLNVTMTNSGTNEMKDVRLMDIFPMGRLIKWPRPSAGEVNVSDPYSGLPSDAESAFLNGSLLRWNLLRLDPGKSASLNMEVELLYPMDAGWKQRLDTGATAAYEGFSYNHTLENRDDWPVVNLTYPTWIYSGRANISWNLDRSASYTALNLYSPDGRSGGVMITDIAQNKLYETRVQLLTPGKWKFNIEAGDGYTHRTENYTIDVRSNIEPLNITAFSHTKVPRLSLVAAQAASAHKALLVDVAKDPQQIDPLNEEAALEQKVDDLKLTPRYLMVVGDPGSMPFISTGLIQKLSPVMEYGIYRDYQLLMDDDNYSEVAVGRIMGLSVYDASQLLARTLAYDRLSGSWKGNGLVISSPPLSFPQAPTASSIKDYLQEAGLNVKDLRYEEATYQQAISQMNNGQNVVHFDHHGNEESWLLSEWSLMDSTLTGSHVKELILSPQTTTASACVTVNLKGYYLNVSGTRMYIPKNLEDSIALAFVRAGAVNYIGESALSWIFVSDDYFKSFYQAMVFDNATVGEAQLDADNLFRLKFIGGKNIKNISEYDEDLPAWDESVQEMLNQTSYMDVILGDPSFRPALPNKPSLPYTTEVEAINSTDKNKTLLKASVTPKNESATDWIYWIETDSFSGKLNLNAPPAIIGEVFLPLDADKIVVKENGLAVWHDEDTVGDQKKVMWPIVRPRLGEERSFQIEYVLIPGQVQRINVTAGWNAVAVYLKPKDPSASKYLKNKPYRGIFSIAGSGWDFGMKDAGMLNVTSFEPGEGYLIDSADNFTIEIPGKPVDLPYRLDLHQGWNMMGLPVNKTEDLNNITVNAEHKKYKYPEAVQKGLVSAFIWKYEGLGWIHLGENETLVPGKAYLVESMGDAKLEFR